MTAPTLSGSLYTFLQDNGPTVAGDVSTTGTDKQIFALLASSSNTHTSVAGGSLSWINLGEAFYVDGEQRARVSIWTARAATAITSQTITATIGNADDAVLFIQAFEGCPDYTGLVANIDFGRAGLGQSAEDASQITNVSVTTIANDSLVFGIHSGRFDDDIITATANTTIVSTVKPQPWSGITSSLIRRTETSLAIGTYTLGASHTYADGWRGVANLSIEILGITGGPTYVSSEYTTSSETRNFSSASYSASSTIRNYISSSYTATSSVRNYVSASITFNSESYGFATGSYSAASSIGGYVSASYTATSSIINYVSVTYSSTAEIRNYATSSISFATSIANYVTGSFSGANEIRNYVTGSYTGNSEIEGFGFAGGSYTATSSIFNYATASYSSSNSINTYASATYNAISSVFNYVSNTYTSAASIRSFVTAFYSSASSIDGLDIAPPVENKLDRNNYTKIANMILSGDVPYSEGADMYIRIGRRGLLNGTE